MARGERPCAGARSGAMSHVQRRHASLPARRDADQVTRAGLTQVSAGPLVLEGPDRTSKRRSHWPWPPLVGCRRPGRPGCHPRLLPPLGLVLSTTSPYVSITLPIRRCCCRQDEIRPATRVVKPQSSQHRCDSSGVTIKLEDEAAAGVRSTAAYAFRGCVRRFLILSGR